MFSKPHIEFFRADSKEAMANEKILLEWKVEHARKVRLDGVEVSANDSNNLFITNNRTFELEASNRLGTSKVSLSVNLRKPEIVLFETNITTASEDVPVEINFQLKNSLSWSIQADYGSTSKGKIETISAGEIKEIKNSFEKVFFKPQGACLLTLIAKNGLERTASETIKLYAAHASLEMSTNKTVVKAGSSVRIKWKAQNAKRIELMPGNINITNLTYYDFIAKGERDLLIEITAFGDFGQMVKDSKTIYLANIHKVYTTNNENITDPVFYLNWLATGLRTLKLFPENLVVNESETNHIIDASSESVPRSLMGETIDGEPIVKEFELQPCAIGYFKLEKAEVIAGTMATLIWEIKNCKKIQLKFSDDFSPINVPPTESKFHFQALKGRETVKLIAWGDVNVAEDNIPIQIFESPKLKSIHIPIIDFHLSVTWIPSPLMNTTPKKKRMLSFTNAFAQRDRRFTWRLFKWMILTSESLLHLTRVTLNNKQFSIPDTANRLLIIFQQLTSQLIKTLKKKFCHEH